MPGQPEDPTKRLPSYGIVINNQKQRHEYPSRLLKVDARLLRQTTSKLNNVQQVTTKHFAESSSPDVVALGRTAELLHRGVEDAARAVRGGGR